MLCDKPVILWQLLRLSHPGISLRDSQGSIPDYLGVLASVFAYCSWPSLSRFIRKFTGKKKAW